VRQHQENATTIVLYLVRLDLGTGKARKAGFEMSLAAN